MPVYSMTGFATVTGKGFSLTMKSVNHRFLDLQVRVPAGYEEAESVLVTAVKGAVRRGHVEVSLHLGAGEDAAVAVRRNDVLLGELVAAYREAAGLHGLSGKPGLDALMRVPGVLVADARRVVVSGDDVRAGAVGLLDGFQAARATEGATLAAEMRGAMDRLLALTEETGELRVGVREAHVTRLRSKLQEMLEGVDVGEERVMMEAALLAQRSDVEEEIVRMRTHARQFGGILDAGGEVGKRLDFLLQEMNREANTMVSKVNGAMGERGLRLTEIGLAMKMEIERVKEQVQNVE